MKASANFKKGSEFERFVISVLKKEVASQDKKIEVACDVPDKIKIFYKNKYIKLDAYLQSGIDDIKGPVIVEIKYSIKSTRLIETIKNLYSQYCKEYTSFNDICTVLLITNSYIDDFDYKQLLYYIEKNFIGMKFEIYSNKKIEQWVKKYYVDYINAIEFFVNTKTIEKRDTEQFSNDIIDKNNNRIIDVLRNNISYSDGLALVLGAGVSIDLGALDWIGLINKFKEKIKNQYSINYEELVGKIGDSSFIKAQLCKEASGDVEYYWEIHQGLYSNANRVSPTMQAIVDVIKKCHTKKTFRVLTYNYDNFLEESLLNVCTFNTLFASNYKLNENLPIYHVHGYLPRVQFKTYMKTEHKKSVCLTEEDYNELYNNPYSWQIASQLSFFRENTCLFIGCGLKDPNIRRLLVIAKNTSKAHYAILSKGKMKQEELSMATRHFARLGLEIVWINSHKDIPNVIQRILR